MWTITHRNCGQVVCVIKQEEIPTETVDRLRQEAKTQLGGEASAHCLEYGDLSESWCRVSDLVRGVSGLINLPIGKPVHEITVTLC